MAAQFVIGRAGSGKTRRCFDSIVAALRADPLGTPIYWILPKQATFDAERRLTCEGGLGGFCRAQVVSFETLADEVLADCGGDAVPQITAMGRQMLIGHLLRTNAPKLKFFSSVARQVGLAAELDGTFGEIEKSGKTEADLAALLHELEQNRADLDTQTTLSKLQDVLLLYRAYSAYLGQDRLDPHRRLQQVLASVESCRLFEGADVFVDGFVDFTDYERRFLAALAKVCRRMEVALLIDPDSPIVSNPHLIPHELSLFHRTEQTFRKLYFTFTEAGASLVEPVLLREIHRFANPALGQIERIALGSARGQELSSEGILLIEAPDRRAEVDAAARQVRDLLRQDLRLRDIAVLVRDIDQYEELINAGFREHGIRYFVDRRRTAAHHPLISFTRAVFAAAHNFWTHAEMMTILKSGLAGLSLDEADELENYVLLHRIRGGAWADPQPWNYRRALTTDEEADLPPQERVELEQIHLLRRRVMEKLEPFAAALRGRSRLPLRKIVTELFKLYAAFDVRQTLTKWMEAAAAVNQIERRGEHEQVWGELVALFDQMVDLLGDETMPLADFVEILESGLEQFDLALTPPAVDEVLVGQVDRTRTGDLRGVIVLGLAEGQFPKASREDNIFSDRERRKLQEKKLDVEPDSQRRLLDENLLGYVALTRASERLILIRSCSDEAQRPQPPSPFWRRLRELGPGIEVQTLRRSARPDCGIIGTPRQLVTSLMKWVRDPHSYAARPDGDGAAWPALYHWLATHACCSDAIDVMRFRAWKALSYRNQAELSPEVAQRLFPSPLHASVSRIETFSTCPFRHFARYGLALQDREDPDVSAIDLGNIYHQILERIVRQMLRTRSDWIDLAPQVSREMIKQFAEEVGRSLRGELMLSNARNRYLLDRIERTLEQVIAHQRAARARGRFKPLEAELTFGGEGPADSSSPGKLPPFRVATPEGHEVVLHGKIDRVDRIPDSSAIAIIDYKLRGNALSLERVYHGISLQLLTYLLVLQKNGEPLLGRKPTPVAAFYLQLLRRLKDVNNPDEEMGPDDPRFELRIKPRGIVDERFVRSFDGELQAGHSDVIQAFIKTDGSFGRRNQTDVAEVAELAALLAHVEQCIGKLADGIIAGRIDVRPYRINRQSPCPSCEFRSMCRFDPALNQYHNLSALGREQVLQIVCGKEGA